MGALYRALDAGLRGKDPERDAENQFMALAADPGLDIVGKDVYAVAIHHAKLAGIISVALRSAFAAPWSVWGVQTPTPEASPWSTALYDAGNGIPRRVVLADRWSDDRHASEVRSWRTLGELAALRKSILITDISIGSSKDGRRHSPWTRCYRHPRNRTFRFKRKLASEDFGANWQPEWRESSDIATADWIDRMQRDECVGDLVQTIEATVPSRVDAFVAETQRIQREMAYWQERPEETPPMRLAGCSPVGGTPCPFLEVCHGRKEPTPERYGFTLKT